MENLYYNAFFYFDGRYYTLQFNIYEKALDLLERFASEIQRDVNNLTFIYHAKPLERNQSLGEQMEFDIRDNIKIYIMVYESDENYKVLFIYKNNQTYIQCKNEKMSQIILRYSIKANLNIFDLKFVCGDKKVNFDFSFKEQLAYINVEGNELTVYVYDCEENSKVTFNYNGKVYIFECNTKEKTKKVFQKFSENINKDMNDLTFSYKKENVSNECLNLPFDQIIDEKDILANLIKINVIDKPIENLFPTDDIIINPMNNPSNNNNQTNLLLNDIEDTKTECHCCLNIWEEYEEKDYYKKAFLIIIIQHLIIIFFLILDIYYDLNKPFIKKKSSIIWTSLINGYSCVTFCLITFMAFFADSDEKEDKDLLSLKKNIFDGLYCLIFSTPSIIMLCLVLTKYVNKIYFLITLCQILSFYITLETFILFIKSFKVLKFIIPLLFDTILSFLILLFVIVKDIKITIYISIIIGLSFSFYLEIIICCIQKIIKDSSYTFGALMFVYMIFLPIGIASGLAIAIPILFIYCLVSMICGCS